MAVRSASGGQTAELTGAPMVSAVMMTMLPKRSVVIWQQKGYDSRDGDDGGGEGGCVETAVVETTTR